MPEAFKTFNSYLILTTTSHQEGTIEIPDSAREIGAPSGKVLFTQSNTFPAVGDVVFFDGSKAIRIRTAEGEYVAIKQEDIICQVLAEQS
jgi:co-chaperonin GroES (HSP10)